MNTKDCPKSADISNDPTTIMVPASMPGVAAHRLLGPATKES